jgi:tRNA(Ile)-lysidine synthase
MLNRMERFIRAEGMIPPGSRVLCALSGGADSVCLLGALYQLREKLGFSLLAAHYNHNLRGEESLRDEHFVRELLKTRFPDVQLHISGGDVSARAREMGTGLEETAREMRYAFLQETARNTGSDRIATAHTADDNAETVLLHLARGTGLQGLTGIAPIRGNIIRPLLTATRQDVEDFLSTNDLPHVEDSSNCDDYFARNRVRHQVIPVLEGLYPGFSRRVTENAAHLREDLDFLNHLGAELAAQAEEVSGGFVIPARNLSAAPRPVAIRAVRQLLA